MIFFLSLKHNLIYFIFLAFLIHELEVRCCKLRLDPSPISLELLDMNIDVGLLLDVYSRLVSLNERIWGTPGNEHYLIKSVDQFTSYIARQPNLITKNRMKIVAKVQDITSACLNLLYTKPDTKVLIDSLRDTQTRIQRILS